MTAVFKDLMECLTSFISALSHNSVMGWQFWNSEPYSHPNFICAKVEKQYSCSKLLLGQSQSLLALEREFRSP